MERGEEREGTGERNRTKERGRGRQREKEAEIKGQRAARDLGNIPRYTIIGL